MEFRWKLAPSPNPGTVKSLQQELGVEERIARMLAQRGVNTFEEARIFFRPSLDNLHDPFLMKDMDLAVDRVQQALEEGERILIYGDYDVDGTTSVAALTMFFEHFYADSIDYYIPDRYEEGYGISFQGIDYAEQRGMTLIIALDCGIRAHDKVEYAKEKGIDFIICDHHLPHDELPKAVAVLDHKRNDDDYPYKELTGCGIGFKLCQALCSKLNFPDSYWKELLDLVAVSTACDIVPITGENRTLVHLGMEKLNSKPTKGLAKLIENSNKKGRFSVTDVVFVIGPRINAAGRIEHAKKAVEMLLANEEGLVERASELLEERNRERRELDKTITSEALEAITSEGLETAKSTVLFSENWHKGVIGIVASRLIESYYRPTIVLTASNGKAVGSARSVKGFNIHDALDACSDVLDQFGGHAFAAGMTLEIDRVGELRKRFESVVTETIEEDLLVPSIEVDEEIGLDEITPKFWRIINQFAPFGPENMKPVFVSRNLKDGGWTKNVGDGSHLKLDVVPGSGGPHWSGIAFAMGDKCSRIKSGDRFDLAYTIDENEWQGKKSLQLVVKDIKFTED